MGNHLGLYSSQKGCWDEVDVDLFTQVKNDRTRANSLKLCQGRFRLDISEKNINQNPYLKVVEVTIPGGI